MNRSSIPNRGAAPAAAAAPIQVPFAWSCLVYGILTFSVTAFAGEFTGGKEAASVLGQADFVSGESNRGGAADATTMDRPSGVAVDPTTGRVFVVDRINNRVLRFTSAAALTNGAPAEAVLGQPDFATTGKAVGRSRMDDPTGATVDSAGRLWVSDSENHRVLRFDNAATKSNGANADGVLGQPDFDSSGIAVPGPATLRFPIGLAFDSGGNLWVAENGNHRVVKFENAALLNNGADADFVLGQPDLTSKDPATTASGLRFPTSLEMDADGRLWVADTGNHRVLRYNDAASKNKGGPADGVLGQINFTLADTATTTAGMNRPIGLSCDSDGNLWVSDTSNHRTLRFDDAALKGDGASADVVLGQGDFISGSGGIARDRLNLPEALFADGTERLWVCDTFNNRILRFQTDSFQPDNRIGTKPGNQRGNGIYNDTGAGQKITATVKGNRSSNAFLTVENDGDVADTFTVTASKGNRKLSVKYLRLPGGNVTAAITRGGAVVNALPPRGVATFKTVLKGTRASRDKRAGRTLTMRSVSQNDGEDDTVKAKVKKKP